MKSQPRNGILRGLLLPAATVALASACAGGSPAPMACGPVEPGAISQPGLLAGSYRVTAVATGGAMAGNTVVGSLTLVATGLTEAGSASGFRMAYRGFAGLDLGEIGALELGSVASRDTLQPGVIVQVRELEGSNHDVLMRFGSEANSGRTRFDGGYTVFIVHQLSDGAFAGRWNSGVSRTDAEGYFCGERVSE